MLTRSNACVGFLRREAICLRLLIVYVEIGRAVSLGDVTIKYGLKFILSNGRLDSQNMISGGEKGASAPASAVSSSRNSSTLLPTFLATSNAFHFLPLAIRCFLPHGKTNTSEIERSEDLGCSTNEM